MLLLRMNVSRYNHGSNLMNVVGYVADTEESINASNMQGWRGVPIKLNPNDPREGPRRIYFKNTANGVLVDIANASVERDDDDHTPIMPSSYSLTVTNSDESTTYISESIDAADVLQNQGGMHYLNGSSIPNGVELKVAISIGFLDSSSYSLSGSEPEFVVTMNDPAVKNKLINNGETVTLRAYENSIDVQLYCTRYGQPYTTTTDIGLSLGSSFGIDTGGARQYNSNFSNFDSSWKSPEEKIQAKLLASSEFRDKYGNLDEIDQTVFQGHLDEIVTTADYVIDSSKLDMQHQPGEIPTSFSWLVPSTQNTFALNFLSSTGVKSTTADVAFVNGIASVKLALNTDLTEDTNPRFPTLESLAVQGNISVTGNPSTENLDFCCIFFQNPSTTTKSTSESKPDWVSTVGPELRKMALLYPSMQKIVDLYDFKGVSMAAMKRAFDI